MQYGIPNISSYVRDFFMRGNAGMEQYIETERLVLKPVAIADAPAVFIWTGDPEVNRYMAYPLHTQLAETKRWIASLRPENLEFGFYRKEDGLLIGTGGIGPGEDGLYHLGYNLRRDMWGRGYATEAAKAMLLWGHRELSINDFAAEHAIENGASGNVIRKCGFQLVRYGQYSKLDGSETFDAAFYELHLKGES